MRTVSVAALKERIRKRTDQENSDFISNDELLEYINAAYAEFYGLITTIYEDYYVASADIDTVADANLYNLPSNFFKMSGVDYNADTDEVVELRRFEFTERNRLGQTATSSGYGTNIRYKLLGDTITFVPAPTAGKKIRLWYIPSAPILISDTQLIDGINGYEEMIIAEVAIRIMNKQEQDNGPFVGAKRAVIERIKDEAPNRDAGTAPKVGDSRGLEDYPRYPWHNGRR